MGVLYRNAYVRTTELVISNQTDHNGAVHQTDKQNTYQDNTTQYTIGRTVETTKTESTENRAGNDEAPPPGCEKDAASGYPYYGTEPASDGNYDTKPIKIRKEPTERKRNPTLAKAYRDDTQQHKNTDHTKEDAA